ncbi:MAG: hypothetical protein JWM20_366 [Patescibacteria group bacterium]|nr:hypothetical protein [Patescibacteria group bacterium]
MKSSVKTRYQAWRNSWRKLEHDHAFITSALIGVVFIAISLATDSFANVYATAHAGIPIGDVILSNTHPINVFYLFIYGPVVLAAATIIGMAAYPRRIPFMMKAGALLVLARSASVCLTHLGYPTDEILPPHIPWLFQHYFLGADLFFSGHVAQPLLVAFLFWDHKAIRWFFLLGCVLMAFVVLAGHYHYSIDVLGALFAVPTIFFIAMKLFPRDYVWAKELR